MICVIYVADIGQFFITGFRLNMPYKKGEASIRKLPLSTIFIILFIPQQVSV